MFKGTKSIYTKGKKEEKNWDKYINALAESRDHLYRFNLILHVK